MTSRVARKDRRGRTQRRRTPTAQARRPDLSKFYGRKLAAITAGEYEFELTLLRGRGAKPIPLDDFAEAFEWNDEETAMSGSVTLRRPEAGSWASLPIGRGHRVRCRVKWPGRKFYELWTMRVDVPETTIEPKGVTLSVPLADDLDLVARGKKRYLYRRTKRRRHGWFGHEALRDAARKEGVRLGAIVKCRKREKKIDVKGSLLDLVKHIYDAEAKRTGRQYIVRMRDGRLEVVAYSRNRTLYELNDAARSLRVKQTPKVAKPVTVWKGTARLGKGAKAKKIRHTEYRRAMVDRFGRTTKTKDYGHVDSHGELRAKVRLDLAKQYLVEFEVEAETQGVPFIRRGDAVRVPVPSERIVGERAYLFCTAARHQVQGQSYTSAFSFDEEDEFEKYRERREKEARERARKRRKKRKRGDD